MAERVLSYTERRTQKSGGDAMGRIQLDGASARQLISGQAWHPTVINLLLLVVLEIGAYAGLRYAFRQFHGG